MAQFDQFDHSLQALLKAADNTCPDSKKNGKDEKSSTGDKDKDGVPNALDKQPDEKKGEGESPAEETKGDQPGVEDDAGDFPPEDENGLPLDEGAEPPPMTEEEAAAADEQAAVDDQMADEQAAMDTEKVSDLITQLAAAEKDFYAAKGAHGDGHHKAEGAMDVFHKLVRKLAKEVAGQHGLNGDGSGPELEPEAPLPPEAEELAASLASRHLGPGGQEMLRKTLWPDMQMNPLTKSMPEPPQPQPQPHPSAKMGEHPNPDAVSAANYVGDPNNGTFVNWDSHFASMGAAPIAEAGDRGEPSMLFGQMTGKGSTPRAKMALYQPGIQGDNPYKGSNAGEAHPHYGYDEGNLDPKGGQRASQTYPTGPAPGSPPTGKMGGDWINWGDAAKMSQNPMPFAAQIQSLMVGKQTAPMPAPRTPAPRPLPTPSPPQPTPMTGRARGMHPAESSYARAETKAAGYMRPNSPHLPMPPMRGNMAGKQDGDGSLSSILHHRPNSAQTRATGRTASGDPVQSHRGVRPPPPPPLRRTTGARQSHRGVRPPSARMTGKKQQHPVSESQRRWAYSAEKRGELPRGTATKWSKRVEGQNLPASTMGKMSEHDMHEAGHISGFDYTLLGRMARLEHDAHRPFRRSFEPITDLYKSEGPDVFEDLVAMGDDALSKAEVLLGGLDNQ